MEYMESVAPDGKCSLLFRGENPGFTGSLMSDEVNGQRYATPQQGGCREEKAQCWNADEKYQGAENGENSSSESSASHYLRHVDLRTGGCTYS